MNLNYLVTAIVIVVALAVLIYLIRKNRKDEKAFEQDMTRSEIEPEEHKNEKI